MIKQPSMPGLVGIYRQIEKRQKFQPLQLTDDPSELRRDEIKISIAMTAVTRRGTVLDVAFDETLRDIVNLPSRAMDNLHRITDRLTSELIPPISLLIDQTTEVTAGKPVVDESPAQMRVLEAVQAGQSAPPAPTAPIIDASDFDAPAVSGMLRSPPAPTPPPGVVPNIPKS